MSGRDWQAAGGQLAARWLRLAAGVADSWAPPLLIVLFALATAVVLVRQPLGQNADGLIGTLASVQHLTLFFWGQDRFANLVPALAWPVRDPHANALAQVALRTALGLAAPLFVCMLVLRHAGTAWRATLLASTLLLALAPQRIVHEAFIEASPYGTSFALAGFALLALRRAGRAPGGWVRGGLRLLALGLVCTAYLVNASLVLIAAPLVVGEALLLGSALAAEFAVASLVGGGLAWALAAAADTAEPTSRAFGSSLFGLAYYGRQLVGKQAAFLPGMVLLAGLAPLLLWSRQRPLRAGIYYVHGAVLAGAFAATFVALALSDWVVINHMHPRYLVPHFFLAAAMGGLGLARLLRGALPGGGPRQLALLASCACLLAVATRRQPPSSLAPHEVVDPSWGPTANAVAAAVVARRVDVVAGDYWDVWPAVFQAEQAVRDAGLPTGRVIGAAYRGQVRRNEAAARLAAQGRLEVACIGWKPEVCNATLLSVMSLSVTGSQDAGAPMMLPDGRTLSFFAIGAHP